MASISFNVPDAKVSDLLSAFCQVNGYSDLILDMQTGRYVDNPESQTQFVKRLLREFYVSAYRQVKIKQATDQATQSVHTEVQ